jgi:hypothetical protein
MPVRNGHIAVSVVRRDRPCATRYGCAFGVLLAEPACRPRLLRRQMPSISALKQRDGLLAPKASRSRGEPSRSPKATDASPRIRAADATSPPAAAARTASGDLRRALWPRAATRGRFPETHRPFAGRASPRSWRSKVRCRARPRVAQRHLRARPAHREEKDRSRPRPRDRRSNARGSAAARREPLGRRLPAPAEAGTHA